MPPVEMLLALSELYGVSMNELVAGARLTTEELPAKAEENLTAIMKDNAIFQLQERKDFWQNKWNRDHRGDMILLATVLLAFYLTAVFFDIDWMALAAVLAAVFTSMFLTNRRAGYVEHHLYDDKLDA